MVSWLGTAAEWLIWANFRTTRAASEDQILDAIRDGWERENSTEIIPDFIADASDLKSGKEVFDGPTQKWEVVTVAERESAGRGGSDKIVVYWHGGAFKNRVLRRLAIEFSCTTILPRYTLLPLTTANEWSINATSFLLSIADDPRYAGKEIVLMGDSAGGWMALRLLEVLCEMALGERGTDGEREKAVRIMKRMGKAILLSATVDSELTQETRDWAPKDFWLSVNLFTTVSALWSYGPSAFPDRDFHLPSTYTPLPGERLPISDPTYSPRNGVRVFARYRKAFPERSKIHIASFIAKHDLLYPGNVKLADTMRELGEENVDYENHVEEGLYHVYAIIDLLGGIPEYNRAWVELKRIFTTG